jgi:hypothetical protein
MTDNEIIKAFDLNKDRWGNLGVLVFDLIKRQKAEIARLQKSLVDQFDGYENIRKKARAEAIKEFADRLSCMLPNTEDIDRLVEEMTE